MTLVLGAARREELRKLAEGATPGPWTMRQALRPIDGEYDFAVSAEGAPVLAEAFGRAATTGDLLPAEANAAYIAAMSPDTTLALLAYIAELEAGLRGARERFAQIECKVIDGMFVTTPSKMIEWQKAIASHGFNETSALLPKASVREEPDRPFYPLSENEFDPPIEGEFDHDDEISERLRERRERSSK